MSTVLSLLTTDDSSQEYFAKWKTAAPDLMPLNKMSNILNQIKFSALNIDNKKKIYKIIQAESLKSPDLQEQSQLVRQHMNELIEFALELQTRAMYMRLSRQSASQTLPNPYWS